MGARNTGGGYEILKKGFRLRFMWQGKRRTPYLELAPTAKNEAWVKKLLAKIVVEIEAGVFDYTRHFPDSKEAKAAAPVTFNAVAEVYLRSLVVDYGTHVGYTRALRKVWGPAFGDRPLASIKPSEIKAIIAERRKTVSAKATNNDLTPLRKVFEMAIDDGDLEHSPATRISNTKHQGGGPDPFLPQEVLLILDHLRERAPEAVWAYYQFAFATGMRPSEQIVLRWNRLSLIEQTIKVDRARTRAREKGTKTKLARVVDLTPPALEALTAMRPHTFMQGPEAMIFCNPDTGRPWTNDQLQRKNYFHPALRKLGIRSRDAYQTRHTFATLALMGENVNPAYVAKQMGHVDTRMFFEVYSHWINAADNGRQKARLATSWPRAGHEGEKPQAIQSISQVPDLLRR